MALNTTSGAADRIEVPAASSLDNLSEFTWMLWVRPTTTPADSLILLSKAGGGGTGFEKQLIVRTGLAWQFDRNTSATAQVSRTNTSAGSILTVGAWNIIAAVVPPIGSNVLLYLGTATSPVAEVAGYAGGRHGGTGTPRDESDQPFRVSNGWGSMIWSVPADYGPVAVVARQLTLAELQAWQFSPGVIPDTRLLLRPGDNGLSTQRDLSGNGNHGTVTNGSVVADPPLPRWRRRGFLYVPVGSSGVDATPGGFDLALALGVATPSVVVAPAGLDLAFTTGEAVASSATPGTGLDLALALGSAFVALTAQPAGLDLGLALGSAAPSGIAPVTGLDIALALGASGVSVTVPAAGLDLQLTLGAASADLADSTGGLDLQLTLGSAAPAVSLAPAGLNLQLALGTAQAVTGDALVPGGLDLDLQLGSAMVGAALAPGGLDCGLALGGAGTAVTVPAAGFDLALGLGPAATSTVPGAGGFDLALALGTPGCTITPLPAGCDLLLALTAARADLAIPPAGLDLGLALGTPTVGAGVVLLPLSVELLEAPRYSITLTAAPRFTVTLET